MSDGTGNTINVIINGESLFANEAVRELARAAIQDLLDEYSRPPERYVYRFSGPTPPDEPEISATFEPDPEDCAGCRFSTIARATAELLCRRNPPTDKGFPRVSDSGWCGEFQRS